MNFFGKNNKLGISQTDPGDRGSFLRLIFSLLWLGIRTRAHDVVFAALAGLLAIVPSQFLMIDSYLDSNAMDSKGFRRRKLRKPPDKTNNPTTTAHTHPQKQLNNLILRFKTNEQTVSRIRQKRMWQSTPRVSCNNTWNLVPANSTRNKQTINKFIWLFHFGGLCLGQYVFGLVNPHISNQSAPNWWRIRCALCVSQLVVIFADTRPHPFKTGDGFPKNQLQQQPIYSGDSFLCNQLQEIVSFATTTTTTTILFVLQFLGELGAPDSTKQKFIHGIICIICFREAVSGELVLPTLRLQSLCNIPSQFCGGVWDYFGNLGIGNFWLSGIFLILLFRKVFGSRER